ncbi:MAG TPA: DUF6166 domain-containing protein [Anaerolineae bacterium]
MTTHSSTHFHGWRDGDAHVSMGNAMLAHVCHHSPTGFEWGYGGSGPADLALSILSAVIDEPKTVKIHRGFCGAKAWALHQPFKWEVIAGLGREWTLSVQQVKDWIALYEKEHAKQAKAA